MGKVYLIFFSLMIAITAQSVLASKDQKADVEDYKHLSSYSSVEAEKRQ